MAGETTVTLVGNLTGEPDLRFVNNGTAVTNFTVASTPRIFKDGDWKDGDPLFIRCNLWRQPAENVSESLHKGDRVIVTGYLKQRSYEKDGVKHTVIECEVDEVGPSLKFATAKVTKAGKSGGGRSSAPVNDNWASDDSEPPF
jgi:single-strand DNA-binding protein